MKDNVSEYLKNSLGSTDKQRSDIISKLFGSNGLVAAEEFESMSGNLISENPELVAGPINCASKINKLYTDYIIQRSDKFW
jgi:hypothetical protein